MSIIEHTHVPAGWYPDGVADDSLRWWDGTDWTNDVRSAAAPILVAVAPIVVEYVPGESLPNEPSLVSIPDNVSELLASAPEPQTAVEPSPPSALSRRQLREMLGGPLVTDTPTDQ